MNLEATHPDLSAVTRALAKVVHKDLLNDERLSCLEPQYDKATGVFHWSAQNVEQQQLAYIPVPHAKELDFTLIKELQEKLLGCIIIMAIVDNTGNILYYQMTEGLEDKL